MPSVSRNSLVIIFGIISGINRLISSLVVDADVAAVVRVSVGMLVVAGAHETGARVPTLSVGAAGFRGARGVLFCHGVLVLFLIVLVKSITL
jgi:hypothetical protein